MSGLRFERLSDAHLGEVNALFGRVFGRSPGPDVLKRKYDTSYTGHARLAWVAMEGPRAVGFAGVLPQRFTLDGTVVPVGQFVDLAVEPQLRGGGLFRQLQERCRLLARDSGLRMLWGAANDASRAAVVKYGWTEVARLHRRSLPVRTLPLAKIAGRVRPLSSPWDRWAMRVVRARTRPAWGRPNSLQCPGVLCHRYDADLERYRSLTPNARVDLGGAGAWIRLGARLGVGDLETGGALGVRASVARLRGLARLVGSTEVLFQTWPGTPLDDTLEELAPGLPSLAIMAVDADVPLERLRVNLADLDTF